MEMRTPGAKTGRSGQVYSLVAVLFAIPLLLYMAFFVTSSQTIGTAMADRIVADQIHDIERNMESDFARALAISGRRALLAATDKVITEGLPLADANYTMTELVMNGTLGGNTSYMMINNTLPEWKAKTLSASGSFPVGITFLQADMSVSRFSMGFSANLTVNITDRLNKSRIDRTVAVALNTTIEGFEDPLFPLNTLGRVHRFVYRYPYPYYARKLATGTTTGTGNCSGNTTFDAMDPQKAQRILVNDDDNGAGFMGVVCKTCTPAPTCHVKDANLNVSDIARQVLETGYNGTYIDSLTKSLWSLPLLEGITGGYYYPQGGPDIFQRLQGSLTDNPQGFESFVNADDFTAAGLAVKAGHTMVDHLYFSATATGGNAVRGFPEWFRIDAAHAATYGLTELVIS